MLKFSWGLIFHLFVILCHIMFQFSSQLLHRVLVAEVNALQGMAAIGQRPMLMEVNELKIVKLKLCVAHWTFCQLTSL